MKWSFIDPPEDREQILPLTAEERKAVYIIGIAFVLIMTIVGLIIYSL